MTLTWRPRIRKRLGHAEVDLSHFAAIVGMTLAEFSQHMFSRLSKGDVLDLLKIEAAAELCDWIGEKGLEANGERFVVAFRLSLNREKDVGLFCVCRVDMSGDEAIVKCEEAVPGILGAAPSRLKNMDAFEMGFCDMETKP